jgi:hypothetical protein
MLPRGGISRMPATREQRCSLDAGSSNPIHITTGEADSCCHPLHLRIFLSAPPARYHPRAAPSATLPVQRYPCRARTNKKAGPKRDRPCISAPYALIPSALAPRLERRYY